MTISGFSIKRAIGLVIVLLLHINGMSQCKITAPKTLCMGDVGYFSISIPSGGTLVSADWNFGDGYSGTGKAPGHLFSKSGMFKVYCKLNLSGGGICEDSVNLEVLDLPIANFTFKQKDTCLNKNRICVTNKSTAANSKQPIIKNLMIWGDGNITNLITDNCYSYKQTVKYKITLEVTDNFGCKSIKSDTVNIVKGVEAKFSTDFYNTCGSTKVCFTNTSDTVPNKSNQFLWQFNKGSTSSEKYKTPICFTYNKKAQLEVKYLIKNGNGCKDSFNYKYDVSVDTVVSYVFKLTDTSFCYSAKGKYEFRVSPPIGNDFKWTLNGNQLGFKTPLFELEPSKSKYAPGRYALECTAYNGSCTTKLDTFFTIKGPVARIKIFNKNQCEPNAKVYFIDSSKVTNYAKSSRFWVLKDTYGDSCISNRAKGINGNRNCNFSTDWYHIHKYTERKASNEVYFYVYDSITKCSDEIKDNVNMRACGFENKDTTCQGGNYVKNFRGDKKPYKFSLDSGKTWAIFPSYLDAKLIGSRSVYLMYEEGKNRIRDYGKDSFQILKDSIYYTYSYLKDQLHINPNPGSDFTYRISKDCTFKDVTVKLKEPKIMANELVHFYWGDGTSDSIKPKTDIVFDSIVHRYKSRKFLGSFVVSRRLPTGCIDHTIVALEFGFEMFFKVDGGPCLRNNMCYSASVYDLHAGKEWKNNSALGNSKILTGETQIYFNDYNNPCYQYKTPGLKEIKFLATDQNGCKDSIIQFVTINEIRANVTANSKIFGCGEIKQLEDSSQFIGASNDKITQYLWDFGNKTYAITQKNPYYSFTKFGKYEVTHIVNSLLGCTDSIKYIVTVEGPEPQFDILSNSIGCEPLVVKLKNNSKNCSQYYWRFGDQAQSTLLDTSKSEVTFTYTKPGTYFIKLTGIDSFYSKSTQSTYFCKSDFPEDTLTRSVTVIPYLKANFKSPDTVCIGQKIDFQNLSDPRIQTLIWDMGDGNKFSKTNTPIFSYTFTKTGSYKVSLKPFLNYPTGTPKCMDTTEKTIIAKGILADFEFEQMCESPLFKFKNKSEPSNPSTKFNWDFGQSNLPNNQSSLENPEHDYLFNRGNFITCLLLKDEFGCADSVCKTIENDYKTQLVIPNVFTPGDADYKNDAFDILIQGEDYFSLTIFNRWGQIIYEADTDYDRESMKNWNGRVGNTGILCPAGTYFYIFEHRSCYGDNELKRITGSITLVR